MRNKKMKLLTGAMVILWMIVVFLLSHEQSTETEKTSINFTKKIVNGISQIVDISELKKEEVVQKLNPYIRKFAHYSLYTIGGFFIIISVKQYIYLSRKNRIITSLVIGILYAISDEIHQHFVIGRACKVVDVYIDALGIATGIAIFLIIIKLHENIKYYKDRGEYK